MRLPDAVALSLGLVHPIGSPAMIDALIGWKDAEERRREVVKPGRHALDGSYTELTLTWREVEIRVRTAHVGEEWVALVEPLTQHVHPPILLCEAAILWNREGSVSSIDGRPVARTPQGEVTLHATGQSVAVDYPEFHGPTLGRKLDEPIALSTGDERSVDDVRSLIEEAGSVYAKTLDRFGDLREVGEAVETTMAWDTVYDAIHHRAISTVSRIWNTAHGGWGMFCWDQFFGAWLASIGDRDLAYSNAIAMLQDRTPQGFVPNYSYANGLKSLDRSQPPVGGIVCAELLRKFEDRWFAEEVFEPLLEWNRWWPQARDVDGLLCWGSNAFDPVKGARSESNGVGDRLGASYESGLDNSPMYDDVPFDPEREVLRLADAGLTGLYVADCEALARIADFLDRPEAAELRERAERYRQACQRLWNERTGAFQNLRTDTGEFSPRMSPTNFYPLIGRCATPEQARTTVERVMLDPSKFWGQWVLPSISRDDPAYPDNSYWRGRIWAPMNFLVYLGLREYDLPEARTQLAEKSVALLLKEWREQRHIHENYNAETGVGGDVHNSDRFYHWGALLGLIGLLEEGLV